MDQQLGAFEFLVANMRSHLLGSVGDMNSASMSSWGQNPSLSQQRLLPTSPCAGSICGQDYRLWDFSVRKPIIAH